MKNSLLYLPLGIALLALGCKKDNHALPNDPGNGISQIESIVSVKVMHISMDTSDILLDPLTGSFAPPVHSVELDNISTETFDSLYLNLEKNDKFQFGKDLILPNIKFEEEGYESFVFPYYSVSINSYQTKESFPSYILPTSFRDTTGSREINGYTLERHYKRINFVADVQLTARDNKGNIIKLTGQLKGSKADRRFFTIDLY